MTQRALILVGDSTSHGGVVLEGADTDTLNGRAIAGAARSAEGAATGGREPVPGVPASRSHPRRGERVAE